MSKNPYLLATVMLSSLFGSSCRTYKTESATLATESAASTDYFCHDDIECRTKLVTAIQSRPDAKYWQVALPESAQNAGENLAIDFAFFAPKNAQNPDDKISRLIVMTSGIHGTEGFVSSALQHLFVKEMLDDVLAQGNHVLLIHGINAYGFRHSSRFTKSRVDLNRNWFVDDNFPGKNFDIALYKKFDSMLNPRKRATYGKLDFATYITTSILPWMRSALNGNLTRAAGEGQYHVADGISYGGQDYEPNYHIVKQVLQQYIPQYTHMLMLDLHTGLGKRQLQLLPNPPYNKAVGLRRNAIFTTPGRTIEETGGADFYASHGDFSDFVCQYAETFSTTKSCTNMLIEYGTLLQSEFEQQTIKSGLKDKKNLVYTLYITTRENQRAHYGTKTESDDKEIKSAWEQMFNPLDQSWRDMVIKETRELFPQYFANFAAQCKSDL